MGLFRQVLFEISQDINRSAVSALTQSQDKDKDGLFIPCPNHQNQTGDERNKLIVNCAPSATSSRFVPLLCVSLP